MNTVINTTPLSDHPASKSLYHANRIVWYLVGIMEVLLAFRFVLKAAGANTAAAFTTFIYNLSHPLVSPFLSVFRTSQVDRQVMEWSTLLAMIVYWLIGWGIAKLFVIGKPVSSEEASEKLDRQDK